MTFQEIKDTIKPIKSDGNAVLFRPTCGKSWVEMNKSFLIDSLDEIVKKVKLVELGLAEYTACEKVMLVLLVEHANYGG